MFVDLWFELSATAQDIMVLVALILVPLLLAIAALSRFRLVSITLAMLRHQWQAGLAMVVLIAIASSINLLTSLQSSSLVSGSARASDPFDLIVAAPGNDIDVLLSVIYLQSDTPNLLNGSVLQRLQNHPAVLFAAPVGFGDQLGGYPMIGTTAEMLSYLASNSAHRKNHTGSDDKRTATQDWFPTRWSVVPGALAALIPGTRLHAEHDMGLDDKAVSHLAHLFTVQPPMPFTGTPWDNASLVPISALWALHGMGEHDLSGNTPPVPAVVVKARSASELYDLRQQFNNTDSMAFFPAEVLARLYGVVGSVTTIVRWITLSTQVLVISAVLLCAFMLIRALSARFRMLHAIGAPYGFRFFLIWLFIAILIVLGVGLGLLSGWLLALGLAPHLASVLSIPLLPQPTLQDLISTAMLLTMTLSLALLPTWLLLRR